MQALGFVGLAHANSAALERALVSGEAPEPERLLGAEWRGYNISSLTRLMGIQKFIKGFLLARDGVEGYNVRVQQNGLMGPWTEKAVPEQSRRYAFFRVLRVNPDGVDHVYLNALLLDYGASERNPSIGVERLLRDYLVQPDSANADLLLGKAYLAIGGWRVPANFFVLERMSKVQ